MKKRFIDGVLIQPYATRGLLLETENELSIIMATSFIRYKFYIGKKKQASKPNRLEACFEARQNTTLWC